jgi:transcription initiation factor TFIIIB Brf1 subunit/transcription initiation factor TFIIB
MSLASMFYDKCPECGGQVEVVDNFDEIQFVCTKCGATKPIPKDIAAIDIGNVEYL